MPAEKEPMTIDDIVRGIRSQPTHDIGKNIEAYEKHTSPQNQAEISNMLFEAAVQKFYGTLSEQLDKVFGGKQDTQIKEKLPEVKKSLLEAFKAYLSRAMPSLLRGIQGVDNPDEQLAILAHKYDIHVLGIDPLNPPEGVQSMTRYVGLLERRGERTVAEIKKELGEQSAVHSKQAVDNANKLAQMHYISSVPPNEFAAYAQPKIEGTHKIANRLAFETAPSERLYEMLRGVVNGTWHTERPGPQYHDLQIKKPEKK